MHDLATQLADEDGGGREKQAGAGNEKVTQIKTVALSDLLRAEGDLAILDTETDVSKVVPWQKVNAHREDYENTQVDWGAPRGHVAHNS